MENNKFQYRTIAQASIVEDKEKSSKFIGLSQKVLDEKEFFQWKFEVEKNYPKATHYCWAYILNEGIERSNDDGEPSNSAGKPILNQIKSNQLLFTALIVVRYYGGTKLGVPGLISAYKNCAKEVLVNSGIQINEKTVLIQLIYCEECYNSVQSSISLTKNLIVNTQYLDGSTTLFKINEIDKKEFVARFYSGMTGYQYKEQELVFDNWKLELC